MRNAKASSANSSASAMQCCHALASWSGLPILRPTDFKRICGSGACFSLIPAAAKLVALV